MDVMIVLGNYVSTVGDTAFPPPFITIPSDKDAMITDWLKGLGTKQKIDISTLGDEAEQGLALLGADQYGKSTSFAGWAA